MLVVEMLENMDVLNLEAPPTSIKSLRPHAGKLTFFLVCLILDIWVKNRRAAENPPSSTLCGGDKKRARERNNTFMS
jgi:hypothetical protein